MEKIPALEDAIEKKSLVGIYSVFYTIAHGDPNFSTGKFRKVMEYVKSKNIEGFIQKFDGEEFAEEEKWDGDYWALVASSLVDNFCIERIDHLEAVGKKVYPIKDFEQSKWDNNTIYSCDNMVNEDSGSYQITKGTTHTTQKNNNIQRGLITDDKKCKVKDEHTSRTRDHVRGLLTMLFGGARR